jgi:hypothetical protein
VNTETHKKSNKCQQYTEIKQKSQQQVIQHAEKYIKYYTDNQPVLKVKEFKCLGCTTPEDDNFLPAVKQYIRMLEDNTWTYPSSKETLEAAGILTITE